MLDYQPDYRSLFNPEFLRNADAKNAAEARARAKKKLDAVKAESFRREMEKLEAARRKRAEEIESIKRAKIEGIRRQKEIRGFSYEEIEHRISIATGTPVKDIIGRRRNAETVFARQAIAYWAVRLTDLSYPQIGRLMGGRDHTTILHAAQVYPAKRAKEGKHRRAAR